MYLTTSMTIEFYNGDIINIPAPSEKTKDKYIEEIKLWTPKEIVYINKISGKHKNGYQISTGVSVLYPILHTEGKIIAKEYFKRIQYEKCRILSYTRYYYE